MSTKLPLAAVGDDAEGALSGLLGRFLRVERCGKEQQGQNERKRTRRRYMRGWGRGAHLARLHHWQIA